MVKRFEHRLWALKLESLDQHALLSTEILKDEIKICIKALLLTPAPNRSCSSPGIVRALHFGDHCLILMVPLPTHTPSKPVSFIFLPSFFRSFLKNFWTRRGTKLGWTLRPEAVGKRRCCHMQYSLEQKWGQASIHPGMKYTCSRCVWRGRGRPCSSCWTCLERPFEMLFLRPYWCRCLPALAPCEAARGIGQVRSHMREGMQHGE